MLRALRVRDLATIADVALELGPGLNVLTGETGAGKSMLVDALALLLGDRADRAAVRPGADRIVVDGEFEQVGPAVRQRLEEAGLDAEDHVVIRREVTAEGRSRAWVNGSPTTIAVLSRLGESLVDLHGQHQTLQLLHADVQRDLLDAFAGAQPAARAVHEAWLAREAIRAEAEALALRRDEAARRADWLRHVVSEIHATKVRPGEDEQLERDLTRLGQAGALGEHARRLADAVGSDRDGATHALTRADRALTALERLDPEVASWRELLDAAWASLDELARRATDYAADIAEDPARLDELERRRGRLDDLKRKHGGTLASVLATASAAEAELELLDTADLDLRTIGARLEAATAALAAAAEALTALRRTGAARLAREVTRRLPGLGLSSGELLVRLEPTEAIAATGAEQVAFDVRLNAGMAPRALARTASGGELSRLMLALKVVLARQDAVATLVFDEVDQGIGGEVGTRVAEALAGVAERHQVLVITHLPQIAARADRHLRVAKAARAGMATSDVSVLHGEDRISEVARMLGDADDANARRLAAGMLG
jgi:DNA repair protein RecN (Recombination protein N)